MIWRGGGVAESPDINILRQISDCESSRHATGSVRGFGINRYQHFMIDLVIVKVPGMGCWVWSVSEGLGSSDIDMLR